MHSNKAYVPINEMKSSSSSKFAVSSDSKAQENKDSFNHARPQKNPMPAEQTEEILKLAASPIAPIRRVIGVKEASKEDRIKTIGLAALAANNLPMDIKDIIGVINEIRHKTPRQKGQIEFTFSQDTLAEYPLRFLNKLSHDKVKQHFSKIDKSVFSTKFGEFIRKKLKIDASDVNIAPDIIKSSISPNKIYNLKGSRFAKLIGNSMLRIPVLNLAIFSLLEVPHIIKAIKDEPDSKNKLKAGAAQTLKSGINLISMVSVMALTGALMSKRLGSLGSWLGIGFGCYGGEKIGKKVNNILFNEDKKTPTTP